MPAGTSIPVSARVSGFSYAIRNIVAEAKKVEACRPPGPVPQHRGSRFSSGSSTPPHLIEAVERALRDGHNGYVPSAGIEPARRAVAAEYTARGVPVSSDRVVVTSGTSEGIELALSALVDAGDEVLVPTPTYPLYTAVLAKIGARAVYYRTDPARGLAAGRRRHRAAHHRAHAGARGDRSEQPDGRRVSEATRRQLIALAENAGIPILADEVYSDVAFDGPTPLLGSLAPDAAIISFSSLSKAYLAPGWRAGWLVVGRSDRLDDVLAAIKQDGRRAALQPGTDAVRRRASAHRRSLAPARVLRGARACAPSSRRSGSPRFPGCAASCRARRSTRCRRSIFHLAAPTRTTSSGCFATTGNLCVYGSGFGMPADRRLLPHRVSRGA